MQMDEWRVYVSQWTSSKESDGKRERERERESGGVQERESDLTRDLVQRVIPTDFNSPCKMR